MHNIPCQFEFWWFLNKAKQAVFLVFPYFCSLSSRHLNKFTIVVRTMHNMKNSNSLPNNVQNCNLFEPHNISFTKMSLSICDGQINARPWKPDFNYCLHLFWIASIQSVNQSNEYIKHFLPGWAALYFHFKWDAFEIFGVYGGGRWCLTIYFWYECKEMGLNQRIWPKPQLTEQD